MVSPAELGFLRATQSEDVATFNPYSRTRAVVFYDNRDNSKVVIIPEGALNNIISLSDLVDSHRGGEEYIIPESQRDSVYAIVDVLLKQNTAFIAPHGTTEVHNKELGKTELTSRLFSDEGLGIQSQEYGDWLLSLPQERPSQLIKFNSIEYARTQNGPYLNLLCVDGLGQYCDVYGDSRVLDDSVGAFGVRFEKTARRVRKI